MLVVIGGILQVCKILGVLFVFFSCGPECEEEEDFLTFAKTLYLHTINYTYISNKVLHCAIKTFHLK